MPGANPTIVSYNASGVKIYNATNSLVLYENKNIFFLVQKRPGTDVMITIFRDF
jgi:hypothetical protein